MNDKVIGPGNRLALPYCADQTLNQTFRLSDPNEIFKITLITYSATFDYSHKSSKIG